MPKATKKKKEKEADFKKAKLKLGKGKKAANNATDTSFKARSIALPSQKQLTRALASAPGEEAGPSSVPTTSSGLTIDDVLVQLRHVNAGVRKESLGHLKEVISSGVSMGTPLGERHGEVAKVVRGISGIISDEDGAARKALKEFLEWYLARLPSRALSPYLSLIRLQLSSALSHIFPAIRLDACKLVELFLETHASEMVGSWPSPSAETQEAVTIGGGNTVFDGLRLSAGLGEEKGAATQGRLSAGSRLVILRAIKSFVDHALRGSNEKRENDEVKPKLGEWTLAELDLVANGQQWDLGLYDWALEWQNDDTAGKQNLSGEGAMEELSKTYLALHSLLLNTFMEAAPSAFGPATATPSADDVSLNLCAVCVETVSLFARALLESPEFDSLPSSSELRTSFSDYLKRMTAWFPFDKRDTAAASEASDALFALSLNFTKLASWLAPRPPTITIPKRAGWRHRARAIEEAWSKAKSDKGKAAATNEAALRMAGEWVEECIEPPSDALAPQISAPAYVELLDVLRGMILRSGRNTDAFQTLVTATLAQASTSAKRRASDALLVDLIREHDDQWSTRAFFVLPSNTTRELVDTWISSAPRTLWELGSRDASASRTLLLFLLRLGQRAAALEPPYTLANPAILPGMAGKLAPFFHITHTTRGGVGGPWARLGEKEQRLALDVARVWAPIDESGKLASAVGRAVEGEEWKAYWGRGRV